MVRYRNGSQGERSKRRERIAKKGSFEYRETRCSKEQGRCGKIIKIRDDRRKRSGKRARGSPSLRKKKKTKASRRIKTEDEGRVATREDIDVG